MSTGIKRISEELGLHRFPVRGVKHASYVTFLQSGVYSIDGKPQSIYEEQADEQSGAGKVLRFASCWARRMQDEMNGGKKIASIAQQEALTAKVSADTGEISAEEKLVAIVFLKKFWVHGEALANYYAHREGATEFNESQQQRVKITVEF